MAGVRSELHDEFVKACTGNLLLSLKAPVLARHKIEHNDVGSPGNCMDEFGDNGPWEWKKQTLMTIQEATDWCMVEVLAESSFWMHQMISCKFSTCLLLW
jgi:hypothetical protein